MLLAPPTPTHAHEDRLSHPRALSPPQSPPTKRLPPSPQRSQPPPMGEVSPHFTSSAHTPTQGRSPQASITPTSIPSERMGVPPSPQTVPPVTTSSGGSVAPAVATSGATPPTPPLHHPLLGYVPHGNKILSRNLNGTLAVTSQPSNESELQLYRVLQRANLLNYYDTFISQGGDDVQQLCEAGEEEFLEIMALVGMASKPLHVRRLQKALQEWVSNPHLFQIPLLPNLPPSVVAGFPSYNPRSIINSSTPPTRPSPPMTSSSVNHNHSSSSPGKESLTPSNNNLGGASPREGGAAPTPLSRDALCHGGSRGPSPGAHINPGHMPPAALQNCQSVEKNPEFLLQFMKLIMNMNEDDPRRMEEIRKYAAIYGRFDCKRKPEKPLTMHEVSVNEAAAQICKYMPALLTRRDELFPLARQVVRDSGYQYSKGHSRSQTVIGREDEPRSKRPRLDSGTDQDNHWKKRHERLEAISDELRAMSEKAEDVRNSLTSGSGNMADLTQQMDAIHTRHAQLTLEQNELMKAQQKSFNNSRSRSERTCSEDTRTDDSESQFSYSANNSPNQVLSSSQGNIIAVANPALSLSSAMPPNHSHLLEEERHLYSMSLNHNNRANNSAIKQEPNSPGNPKQE